MSRWGRVKGTKSPLRVQSSSFLNFFSSENWTAAGRKGFFDTLSSQERNAFLAALFIPYHQLPKGSLSPEEPVFPVSPVLPESGFVGSVVSSGFSGSSGSSGSGST